MTIGRRAVIFGLPLGLAGWASAAQATVYFTPEAARSALFPAATRFVDRSVALTRVQSQAIARASATRVNSPQVRAFDMFTGTARIGRMFIDRVYGKHEFITYAVALDASNAVITIEIMDYRESYGDEVRRPAWRAQFRGISHGEPLELNRPIRNISGATLSCIHVTDGVRRVLTTNAQLFD